MYMETVLTSMQEELHEKDDQIMRLEAALSEVEQDLAATDPNSRDMILKKVRMSAALDRAAAMEQQTLMEQRMAELQTICQETVYKQAADLQTSVNEKDQRIAELEHFLATTQEAQQTKHAQGDDHTALVEQAMAHLAAAEDQAEKAVESEARAQRLVQEKSQHIQMLEVAALSLQQEVAVVAEKDRQIRELMARLGAMEAEMVELRKRSTCDDRAEQLPSSRRLQVHHGLTSQSHPRESGRAPQAKVAQLLKTNEEEQTFLTSHQTPQFQAEYAGLFAQLSQVQQEANAAVQARDEGAQKLKQLVVEHMTRLTARCEAVPTAQPAPLECDGSTTTLASCEDAQRLLGLSQLEAHKGMIQEQLSQAAAVASEQQSHHRLQQSLNGSRRVHFLLRHPTEQANVQPAPAATEPLQTSPPPQMRPPIRLPFSDPTAAAINGSTKMPSTCYGSLAAPVSVVSGTANAVQSGALPLRGGSPMRSFASGVSGTATAVPSGASPLRSDSPARSFVSGVSGTANAAHSGASPLRGGSPMRSFAFGVLGTASAAQSGSLVSGVSGTASAAQSGASALRSDSPVRSFVSGVSGTANAAQSGASPLRGGSPMRSFVSGVSGTAHAAQSGASPLRCGSPMQSFVSGVSGTANAAQSRRSQLRHGSPMCSFVAPAVKGILAPSVGCTATAPPVLSWPDSKQVPVQVDCIAGGASLKQVPVGPLQLASSVQVASPLASPLRMRHGENVQTVRAASPVAFRAPMTRPNLFSNPPTVTAVVRRTVNPAPIPNITADPNTRQLTREGQYYRPESRYSAPPRSRHAAPANGSPPCGFRR